MSGFHKQNSSMDPLRVKRVALYLRVSTGRQAENDVSLPSQRDMTTRYCKAQGWDVTTEFVEPGASATDDRRPIFQHMLEEAASSDRRFDVICVHSFSRFYRNGAEMELTIRKLRKHGVEVVSVTQPTGTDPSQELMRQIIGIFDEYTSKENGKNVTRAMRESAKQGFWNGATPPLGYKIIESEKRGSKIKKKLDIDPVEAELVRLIFQLYAEGNEETAALGIKSTVKWLNERGYRTRRGSTFGIGPVHAILKNACYATGKWPYGRRNSRTGDLHDPSTIVEIDIPPIIPIELFEKAQTKLGQNNPQVTAPRIVNGPILLTGLAVCASCGSGMTRTGTARRNRSYRYYSCAGCHQKGKSVCKGRHVPMEKLDSLIIENVKSQLFAPERMSVILGALVDRQTGKQKAVQDRQNELQSAIKDKEEKLTRLYRAIETDIVELDQDLKVRIKTLKDERDLLQASLERIREQSKSQSALTPERIEAFSNLMREKIDSGDIQARKAYLRAVISEIRVDDHKVSIIGEKTALTALIAGQTAPNGNVSGFVRKWRARNDSNVRPSDS